MPEATVPAGNPPAPDEPRTTQLWLHYQDTRWELVIPPDATPFEAACLAAFLTEVGQQHVLYNWRFKDRVEHYGLQRFFPI